MPRPLHTGTLSAAIAGLMLVALAGAAMAGQRTGPTPPNVDISQRHMNEAEEAIAVNPTNPNNIVEVSNVDRPLNGMWKGVSFDGGQTWATELLGDKDEIGDACCDPTLSFDHFGNLFLSYLYNRENEIPIALSTDGGVSFSVIANISEPQTSPRAPASGRGLYKWVDQPTIIAAEDTVWVDFNAAGPLVAAGAPVTGLGQVGTFSQEVVDGSNNCTYGDISIGPSGQVMVVCALTESGQGGGKLFASVDPDGLGPAGFGKRVFVVETHVGGFDYIPAQAGRSVDSEAGLAWDRTGGPHDGRVYLVYTREHPNESDDMDIYVRHSDDDGTTWSPALRVNDDDTENSQFMSKIALDPTSGDLAVVWYDARNDLGTGGPGDTDGVPNDDAQFWGAFSFDGGLSFTPNLQISAGTSNSAYADNGVDYGDYSGLSFFAGVAHPAWADNSNSTGTNPDGALHELDVYTAAVAVID